METTRRDLMALGAGSLFLGLVNSGHGEEPAQELEAIESANGKVVSEFCAAWSSLDVAKVAEFLSDKIVYQMIDNMPLVKGKEAFVKFVTPFMGKLEKAEWVTSRQHVIGNVVINQRVDNFYYKGGKADSHFKVVGLFLLKEGKIVEWKDYRVPGEKE